MFFGLTGVWVSWPVTDFFAVLITGVFLLREIKIINKMSKLEEAKV